MPVTYSIDKLKKVVTTTLSGDLKLADSLSHHLMLAQDPDFDPSFNELIDGENVSDISMDTPSIFKLGDSCPFSRESKRAIVTGNRPINYAAAYLFQLVAAGNHGVIKVFSQKEKAFEWLESRVNTVDDLVL